jgi:uncharacterized membrane protein
VLASLLSHAWQPSRVRRGRARRDYRVNLKNALTVRQTAKLYRAARREIPLAEQAGLYPKSGYAGLPPLKEVDLQDLRDDRAALERIADAIVRAVASAAKKRIRREEESIIAFLIGD